MEPGGWNFEAADHAIGVVLGVEVHQTTGLLEAGPEDDGKQTHHQNDLDAIHFLLGQRRFLCRAAQGGRTLGSRDSADVTEVTLGKEGLDHQGEEHADTGRDETGLPAPLGGDCTGHETSQQGAQVDAHVEDGEGAVTTVITLLIQVTDHGGDVRLEHAVAGDQQSQTDVENLIDETREHGVGQCQGKLTGSHHDGTDDNGAALAQETIGQPTPDQRGDIDQTGIDAVELQRICFVPAQAAGGRLGSQIEHQQGTHTVVGESFPQFGAK